MKFGDRRRMNPCPPLDRIWIKSHGQAGWPCLRHPKVGPEGTMALPHTSPRGWQSPKLFRFQDQAVENTV